MVKAENPPIPLLPTIALLLLGLVAYTQYRSDTTLERRYQTANLKQVPATNIASGEAIRRLDLGFHRATADVLWLSTIQYVGGGNPNSPYDSLYHMINAVVTTDPNFEYPYLFGGILLPWQGNPQEALDLLERGQKQFPNNGLFPYNAGAVAKIQFHNDALAARFYQEAVGKEGTPPAAALLAGVSLTNLDDRQFALTWWQGVIESTTNATIRERAQVWVTHLKLIISLENTIKQAQKDGYQIDTINDLVSLGYLKSIPPSPLGVPLVYDKSTGKVKAEN